MGAIRDPQTVKLFCGIITSNKVNKETIETLLREAFGEIDFKSALTDFNFTNYYAPEMGSGLTRYWISFKKSILPDELSKIKILTNKLENNFLENGNRLVNIDPGYITPAKVVLASTKDFSHRIYLQNGIYAEITLTFSKGQFVKLPWTYPDYVSETAINFLNTIRVNIN